MTTPLPAAEQTAAARDFDAFWQGKGYEKGLTQPFWLHLLRVLGVESPESFIEFEDAAHGFIDAFIPSTHVLVAQKSIAPNPSVLSTFPVIPIASIFPSTPLSPSVSDVHRNGKPGREKARFSGTVRTRRTP